MDIFFLVSSTNPKNKDNATTRSLQVRKGPTDERGSPIFERSRVVSETPMPDDYEKERELWKQSEDAVEKANANKKK